MDLANITFYQILTMLVIMVMGFLCAKIKIIDEDMNKKLSTFLLLFVNPLVILMSYQRDFEIELLRGLMIAVGLAILLFAIALAVAHICFKDQDGRSLAVERYCAVYSNSGFIGIPLVLGIFGPIGVFYLTAQLTVSNLLMWSHGVAVMQGEKDFSLLKKALISPPLLATIIGCITFIIGLRLPDLLARPIEMVCNMNTPLAMMIAGVSISKANVGNIIKKKHVYQLCLVRLIVIPLIVIVVFSFFNVQATITGTLIIAAACPVAANAILFAYKYERDHLYASELFVASTLLSMLTIPLLVLLI
jgi:predicted permease